MTAAIVVTPNPAVAGQTVRIDATGMDKRVKFALTTVDDLCNEVGITTNTNRPAPDGSFHCGINVPPMKGAYRIRVYQRNVVVADFKGTVG